MNLRLVDMALVPVANTPAEFGAYIRADIVKWGKAIRAAAMPAQ
jgi:tripartite-type tricarboxylate transporter receptor subunit TctC